MKGKTFLLFFMVSILVLLMTGCGKEPSAISKKNEIDLNVSERSYDDTYIPLNIEGTPGKNSQKLFQIVHAFEEANPELEVVYWREIAFEFKNGRHEPWIEGIFIRHRQRE